MLLSTRSAFACAPAIKGGVICNPDRGLLCHKKGKQLKRVPFSLSWFLVLLGWWLLLVDSLVPAEILAGLAVALFAVLLGRRVQRRGELHFQPRLRWLRWLRSLPAGIFHDGILLLVVLWRRLIWRERPHSDFRLVPFPVGADDPESAARRALRRNSSA